MKCKICGRWVRTLWQVFYKDKNGDLYHYECYFQLDCEDKKQQVNKSSKKKRKK